MTVDQHNEKLLLDYQSELNGMIAENKLRELQGYSPAFGEIEFMNLSNRYTDLLHRF